MNAQLAIVRVTLRRLITRKRMIGFVLFASIPALIVLFASTGDRGPERLAGLYHDTTYGILIAVALPVIAIVNATGALGDERRSHTMAFPRPQADSPLADRPFHHPRLRGSHPGGGLRWSWTRLAGRGLGHRGLGHWGRTGSRGTGRRSRVRHALRADRPAHPSSDGYRLDLPLPLGIQFRQRSRLPWPQPRWVTSP